jgi:hypothetical protein
MADIPHQWEAYARFQNRLSSTHCITISAALEQALNVVHQPDFLPGNATEGDLRLAAATAARQDRHRAARVMQPRAR